MENNNEREDKQQNFENDENGEEGEEQLGINSQGEYEEQMEGEEEMINQMEEHEEIGQEGEEQVQQQSIEEGYEEGMDGGEEQVEEGHEEAIENIQEGAVEEAYEEQNGQNNKENIQNNNKNRKINNKKRIELINKKLNSINSISKNNRNNNINPNENIIDKDTIEEKDNNIYINKRNDILSDILGKIQEFKIKKNNKNLRLNYINIFDDLDKELSKGLNKLYNKNNKNNNNINIINNLNEEQKMNTQTFERKIIRNPKFKEIISLINDKEIKPNKNYKSLGRSDLINFMNEKIKNNNNFSNINLFVPKKNNLTNILENKIFGNNYKKIRNDNKKYYISCIDGKAIVNGIRKDIPIISRFSHKNNKLINNNTCIFDDLYRTRNNGSNNFGIRNKSLNINKCLKKNEFNYDNYHNYKRFNINSGDNDFSFNILRNNFSKENLNKKSNNYFLREFKFFN